MKNILNDINKDEYENKKNTNEIICEYNIKYKDNIQILNSYEEVVRNYSYYKGQGIENEKEIKDNYKLYLKKK